MTPDVQQTTEQDDVLAKSKAEILRGKQGQKYEQSRIKLEGSNTGGREGRGGAFRSTKSNRTSELSSGSSQTEEEGSERKYFSTRYRIARGAIKSISHLIQPASDQKDRKNLDRGKWATKGSTEGNTKNIHGVDTQEPDKSSRWRSHEQGSDGSIVRDRPLRVASAELRLEY